ncbi:MAG: IS1096 element passenger TnpR family protein [Bacteroidota bacterium]
MKILTLRILSSENPKFIRDIDIPDEKRFYDLHMAIQAACNYDYSQMTSFYISNKKWEKLQEISMVRMDEDDDIAPELMKETLLRQYLKKKGQRLLYLFDFFSVRMMFIELVSVRKMNAKEAKLNFPRCILSEGKAPPALIVDDLDIESDLDDDIYGPDDIANIDDLDI